MNLETKKSEDIYEDCLSVYRKERKITPTYLQETWFSGKSLIAELERQIESGNMAGVGGHKAFSAALFLSDVKKALEQKHFSRGQEKGHEVKR